MVAAGRLFFIATAVGAALCADSARAMIEPEIGSMKCELVLNDVATNPPSYHLYLTFVQGYLAAKVSSNDAAAFRLDDAAVLSSVINYCRSHAKENFASAIASAVKR